MLEAKSKLKKMKKPKNTLIECLEPGWPTLREAVAAVDWSSLCGLERNFTFIAAVCASGLVHLAGASVVSSSVSQTFHSYHVSILRKPLEASQVSMREATRSFKKAFTGPASSGRVFVRSLFLHHYVGRASQLKTYHIDWERPCSRRSQPRR